MYESTLSFPGHFQGLHVHFDRLRRELDEVFGSAAASSPRPRATAPGSFPAINIGHTAHGVEIQAFAPGLDATQIDITLDRGVLTLSGERPPHVAEGDKVTAYSRERASGRFKRAISLPDDIDPGQVQATYRHGVLRISVARREAAQPQRIEVH